MKILCISDFVDPLIYSQELKNNFPDIDLILCAGDLPLDYIDFIVSILNKPTYFIFGNHNLKGYSIYHKNAKNLPGQTSGKYATQNYGYGGTYAGFQVLKENSLLIQDKNTGKQRPLLIAGASGSYKYNKGLNQYSDFEMKLQLLKMAPKLLINKLKYGTYLDIFLTHASPRHIHDKEDLCHRGFECFNWFMKKYKPLYLVHGHIHLYDMREERITKINDTTVVNAYAHCIIEI